VSSRDWKIRIQDILDAIDSIQNKTEGISFDDFEADETLVKAILYDFIVIGEAATRVPAEIQSRYPDIPWRLMGDLRNVVTHQYFQVRLTIIWNTVKNNLPPLVTELEDLLQQEVGKSE
jgi:uncharacterized protein with HEPN domain